MALPPDPIAEVLPKAAAGVLAEVLRVLQQDAAGAPLDPPPPEGASDVPEPDVPRQIVALQVREVLFGDLARKGDVIQVVKPAGDYALTAGNHGPFLLEAPPPGGQPKILGRYGPDTYPVDLIRHALERDRA